MDDADQLIIPDDLEKALKNVKGTFDFFEKINSSSKRFVIRWIKIAKTKKIRKNRIEKDDKLPSS